MQRLDSETASSADPDGQLSPRSENDTRGKYRILADLKRLEQDSNCLQEELAALESADNVSTVCHELLLNIETFPDPLLPVTKGSANQSWDRWFEGPRDSRNCSSCWIL
ncbi:G-protein gamma-like domain [Dillenia turbinata]|uniref:G-protein gamma-like domain n=1 Tax=Dillenia turbinata TaxID=194707 RepID=A0AAN8VXG5_9MAGN